MEATIEVSGLRKRFGPTLALDGMSFTVLPGQVTGFVGPNGAGKSTTMRIVLGLDAPDAGTALIGGQPGGRGRRAVRPAGRHPAEGGRLLSRHAAAVGHRRGAARRSAGAYA